MKSVQLIGLTSLIVVASCGGSDGGEGRGGAAGKDEMSSSGGSPGATGGDGSGGHEPGSGGTSGGGSLTGGAGGGMVLGGAPSGSGGGGMGASSPVDPGALLFDLPVREAELLKGHELVGDLNGDGRFDSIYEDPYSMVAHTLAEIAIDQGDGTFAVTQTIKVSGSSAQYLLADANADEIPDLLMVDGFHLGAGDGTFSEPVDYPGGFPVDVNGDGRADGLEIRPSSTPHSVVHLALEEGGYEEIALYTFGSPQYLNVGDFDGDGKVDFAVDDVVRRGKGDGTFGPALPSDCSNCTPGFDDSVVGDVNADGRDDLLIAYLNRIEIFLGQENGSLSVAGQIDVRSTEKMTLGYLDDDEHIDLVLTNWGYTLEVLYGNGQGGFEDQKTYHLHANALDAPLIDDRDGDATADIVLGGFWRVLGRGERRFRAAVESAAPGGKVAQIGVLTSAGTPEVIGFSNQAPFYRAAFLGDLTTGEVEECSGPGQGTYRRVGDMTGDGIDDITVFVGDLNVWVGQGGCKFAPATPHAFAGYSIWFHPINDDALLDAVFRAKTGLGITIATGPGTFAEPVVSPFTGFESSIAVADLDGDGHVDVVVADHDNDEITVLLGDAGYQLTKAQVFDIPSNETPYLTASDIDQDEDVDVLMVSGGRLEILRNDGAGSLSHVELEGGRPMRGFTIGDVDQDERLELIAHSTQAVSHAYHIPASGPVVEVAEIAMPSGFKLFDVDRDGDLDLVETSSGSFAVGRNLLFD